MVARVTGSAWTSCLSALDTRRRRSSGDFKRRPPSEERTKRGNRNRANFQRCLSVDRSALLSYYTLCDLRRGSVVRTSVFGWRTFPDLCPIYG